MARKRIKDAPAHQSVNYLIYDDTADGRTQASQALNNLSDSYSGTVMSSRYDMGFDPSSVGGNNIGGRYGLTREGYEAWRPDERSSFKDQRDTILWSDMCYRKHGIIRNVIDLMSDFASQGIRLVHPNKRIERFYQNWFKKVNGPERSERFLNHLYRLGNVVIRYQTARLNKKAERRLYSVSAAADMKIADILPKKREIPWKYVFLHPATIEVVGGSLANFVGNPKYAIKLPKNLVRMIKNPKNDAEKQIVTELPREIIEAANTNKSVLLPQEKTRVFFYKKDDWQTWADPMISSILIDISLYEKLKLADRAALDGAISNIRIFKLGSLEHKIIPGQSVMESLANILSSNTQAGTLDLIWGPDIELIESKTNVHQFLGKEKYEPTLIAIYAGLGIPPTLTGTFGAAGTTNNFISLKTLIQRLEYGRDTLIRFWEEQIRQVQKAMGFRLPARIEFTRMSLGDEAAERALLVQLADRNIISDELLNRYLGHDPEMERIRVNRETADRESGKMAKKAGAYHDPMFEESLLKVFAQTGVITPSEAGLELNPKKRGQQPALLMRQPKIGPQGGKEPVNKNPEPGRPRNSKDTKQRKTKTFKPKVKAMEIWATEVQDEISNVLNPLFLQKFGKNNMRSLTAEEITQCEKVKFGVLSNLEPLSNVTKHDILNALNSKPNSDIVETYNYLTKCVEYDLDRRLNSDEHKRLRATAYVLHSGEI